MGNTLKGLNGQHCFINSIVILFIGLSLYWPLCSLVFESYTENVNIQMVSFCVIKGAHSSVLKRDDQCFRQVENLFVVMKAVIFTYSLESEKQLFYLA